MWGEKRQDVFLWLGPKKKYPKLWSFMAAIVALVKPSWVLIKYPCLFYNGMDHKYVDYLRKFEVQEIFQNKPK